MPHQSAQERDNRREENLYFDNFLGRLIYHSAGYVRLEWSALPMAGPLFRDLLEQVLVLWTQTGSRRLYTDHRGMPPVWREECEWLTTHWLPRVVECHHCRLAVVEEGLAINATSFCTALTQAHDLGLSVAYFTTEDLALAWLQAG